MIKFRQDMERLEKKKQGIESNEAEDAVITALDMEDKWKAEVMLLLCLPGTL